MTDTERRLADCLAHALDGQDFRDAPGLCPRCTAGVTIGRYDVLAGMYTERCACCGLLRGRHTIAGSTSAGADSETSP